MIKKLLLIGALFIFTSPIWRRLLVGNFSGAFEWLINTLLTLVAGIIFFGLPVLLFIWLKKKLFSKNKR